MKISLIYHSLSSTTPMSSSLDPHSFANFHNYIVTHYDIHLTTDFSRKILYGHVDIKFKTLNPAPFVNLDINSLAIERVTNLADGKKLKWGILTSKYDLGQCLAIDVPPGGISHIRVRYSTTPESGAIQWLEPAQTAGKQHPYCYTQCEAILARSLLPCQDTPSVKAPYSITVSCPTPLVAVCSGIPAESVIDAGGYNFFSYNQPNPIPSYLIALVVGNLKKAKIGPRSSIYTEPENLEKAIHEFSKDTENYIRAAEELLGIKYEWGVYDMVILPSAFPYGGMENPNLTFLSSSLMTGDHSLTNVVAHEITHSWSGNYVTNASWSDFWLNEGFTVYIERMILGRVMQSDAYRSFEILCGYNDLKKTIANLADHMEFTKLCPNLTGIDPDDAFSKVPYEKGSLFLYYLETLVGGQQAMLGWLNSYFDTYRGKSVNTAEVKAHFLNYFTTVKKVDPSILGAIDWNTWLHSPGLPPFDPTTVVDKTLSSNCSALAEKWYKDNGVGATSDDLKDFRSKQVMFFLDEIINHDVLEHQTLEHMQYLYGLGDSPNVEIRFRWLQLCLKSKYVKAIPQVADFLSKHGRGLYVKPLYKLLNDVDHDAAVKTYRENCPYYHSVIRNYVSELLKIA